jgi:hypothetical protein
VVGGAHVLVSVRREKVIVLLCIKLHEQADLAEIIQTDDALPWLSLAKETVRSLRLESR